MKYLKHPPTAKYKKGCLVEFNDQHAKNLMAMKKTPKGNGGWEIPTKSELEKLPKHGTGTDQNKGDNQESSKPGDSTES